METPLLTVQEWYPEPLKDRLNDWNATIGNVLAQRQSAESAKQKARDALSSDAPPPDTADLMAAAAIAQTDAIDADRAELLCIAKWKGLAQAIQAARESHREAISARMAARESELRAGLAALGVTHPIALDECLRRDDALNLAQGELAQMVFGGTYDLSQPQRRIFDRRSELKAAMAERVG